MEFKTSLSKPRQNDATPLNDLELKSVNSLVEYTAFAQNASDVVVREALIERFGVQDVAQLKSRSYDEVIRFLVDINATTLLN